MNRMCLMNRMAIVVVSGILILPATSFGQSDASLQLTLPSQFYAVPGVETSIYFDNIVLTKTPEDYRFEVACDIGNVEQRRWTLTPAKEAVGDHKLTITVYARKNDQ